MRKFLVATATQGSADAFVQASIVTGLSAVGNLAYRIREILWQFPAMAEVDCNIQMSLTRKSFAAIPAIAERSLIGAKTRFLQLTTSGIAFYNLFERDDYDKDQELLIVEDPIYFQLDSSSTSASNIGYIRITYEPVRISENDRLQLIADTLAA